MFSLKIFSVVNNDLLIRRGGVEEYSKKSTLDCRRMGGLVCDTWNDTVGIL